MKNIFKNRLFLVIITALLCITGSVCASTIFARDIKYGNTNVESALNDLYDKTSDLNVLPTTMNFAYGVPSQSSTKNYKELNKNVFAGLIGGQRLVCIIYNGKLHCFTNNNLQNERPHLDSVFTDSCSDSGDYSCNNDEYMCIAYSSGDFICIDKVNKKRCDLLKDNNLYCYDS